MTLAPDHDAQINHAANALVTAIIAQGMLDQTRAAIVDVGPTIMHTAIERLAQRLAGGLPCEVAEARRALQFDLRRLLFDANTRGPRWT